MGKVEFAPLPENSIGESRQLLVTNTVAKRDSFESAKVPKIKGTLVRKAAHWIALSVVPISLSNESLFKARYGPAADLL